VDAALAVVGGQPRSIVVSEKRGEVRLSQPAERAIQLGGQDPVADDHVRFPRAAMIAPWHGWQVRVAESPASGNCKQSHAVAAMTCSMLNVAAHS
jgi:hypothetical protein